MIKKRHLIIRNTAIYTRFFKTINTGSYLFDIGTLFRFDVQALFEETFITAYEKYSNKKLPEDWKKRVKIQDLSNLVGLLNTSRHKPTLVKDISELIEETLRSI